MYTKLPRYKIIGFSPIKFKKIRVKRFDDVYGIRDEKNETAQTRLLMTPDLHLGILSFGHRCISDEKREIVFFIACLNNIILHPFDVLHCVSGIKSGQK